MGRVVARVGLVALALSILVIPGSAAQTRCADEYVDSFDVIAKARHAAYSIGQTALIDVRVTDRLTGAPQRDADVGVMVEGKGNREVLGAARTGDNGWALVRLSLKPTRVKPGWAQAWVAAWENINTPVYCTGRYGTREYPRLFRITR